MVQPIGSLGDLMRKGGTVQATCRRCGRVALFSPHELATYFKRRLWDDGWPSFAARLRCAGPDGCGSRDPKVAWLTNNPPMNDREPPRPRFTRKPGGVTTANDR